MHKNSLQRPLTHSWVHQGVKTFKFEHAALAALNFKRVAFFLGHTVYHKDINIIDPYGRFSLI